MKAFPGQEGDTTILGGTWDISSFSGSRASAWSNPPSLSNNDVSARAVCDHLTPGYRSENEDTQDNEKTIKLKTY